MLVQLRDHGTRIWPQLRQETIRIGLQRQNVIFWPNDFVFVDDPFSMLGNEQLPDAGISPRAHRANPAVPSVETPDHANLPRIGRPHREVDAGLSFQRTHVSANLFVSVGVPAPAHPSSVE